MANISKYDPGQELSSLNFGNLIGGPLSAVVEAQILAAESTVKYIKDVGFDENGDPEYVTFTYPKEISPYQAGTPHKIAVKIVAQGEGYNVIPNIEIVGDGYGAKGEAVMVSDGGTNLKVDKIIITNQGYNYTNINEIKVLPVGGSGGAINFNIGNSTTGNIISASVDSADVGSGYTHAPFLKLVYTGNGTAGSGAVLEALIDATGIIVGVNVLQEGTGYDSSSNYTVEVIPPISSVIAEASPVFSSGTPSQSAQFIDMRLEVPLLTMVPIPYIRVEETTINFNAKINSVEKINSSQDIDVSLSLEYEKEKEFSGSTKTRRRRKKTTTNFSGKSKTKFNVSASYKRKDSRGTEIDKTYTMGITVKAVQDEIPAGMEKVLGILENAIISQPSS